MRNLCQFFIEKNYKKRNFCSNRSIFVDRKSILEYIFVVKVCFCCNYFRNMLSISLFKIVKAIIKQLQKTTEEDD